MIQLLPAAASDAAELAALRYEFRATPESRALYARHGFVSETGLMELRESA